MNFIKEVIRTFTRKDKEEFEYFLARKKPQKKRKDVEVFNALYKEYLFHDTNNNLKGDQNYHAIRKRISKELTNYLILKQSSLAENYSDKEIKLLMVKYFIDLKKYEIAWELLEKEEKLIAKMNNISLSLKLQRLKLEILPYYGAEHFESTKNKIKSLQNKQMKADEFQLFFIQIKKELQKVISEGKIEDTKDILENSMNQYGYIAHSINDPKIQLKIIELIRSEYLALKKYKFFAKTAQKYYDHIISIIQETEEHALVVAQLEYIMSHAYFRVRNFNQSLLHLDRLKKVMKNSDLIAESYQTRFIALVSSINVFMGKLDEAIDLHKKTIEGSKAKLSNKEYLNLSLNLVAYYCTRGDFSKANRIILFMNESDLHYQKQMGREWLIRKELIRTLVQIELGNIEISIRILKNLKNKHEDMLLTDQYTMVFHYINIMLAYLNDPFKVNKDTLNKMEEKVNFKKDKLFDDPKLLSFYVWLKSKIVNKNLYELLQEEYRLLELN